MKVAKLSDDDIEDYLTTFERQMAAYEIDKKRWAYLLAPKLFGPAQQAYMVIYMDDENVGDYDTIRKEILKCYGVKSRIDESSARGSGRLMSLIPT